MPSHGNKDLTCGELSQRIGAHPRVAGDSLVDGDPFRFWLLCGPGCFSDQAFYPSANDAMRDRLAAAGKATWIAA